MAFVHKNKDVPRFVATVQPLGSAEFVDDAGDDVHPLIRNQSQQMPPVGSTRRAKPRVRECRRDLLIQLFSVGDDHYAWMVCLQLQQQIFRHHHHGQTFSAALCMPDHTTAPVSFFITLFDCVQNFLYRKILLISADLFHIVVKQHEILCQFQQTDRCKQGNNIFILHRWCPNRGQSSHFPVQEICILLFPDAPKLFRCTRCCIAYLVFIGRHYDLRKRIKLGDIVRLLVTAGLLNGLFHRDIRSLAFNHRKRNSIDKQHDVRAGIMLSIGAFHRKFFRDMVKVLRRVLPVNVLQVEVQQPPFAYSFGIAFTQHKRIIDFLAGAHKAVRQRYFQIIHGVLNVDCRKFIFHTAVGIAVQFPQLTAQHIPQQHPVATSALLTAFFRGEICIPHGLQQFQRRLFADVGFGVNGFIEVHGDLLIFLQLYQMSSFQMQYHLFSEYAA